MALFSLFILVESVWTSFPKYYEAFPGGNKYSRIGNLPTNMGFKAKHKVSFRFQWRYCVSLPVTVLRVLALRKEKPSSMNIAHGSFANTWSNISSEKQLLMLSVSMIKLRSAKIKFKHYCEYSADFYLPHLWRGQSLSTVQILRTSLITCP